jgi:uncharacterized protein (TIGR02246 family)
LANEFAKAIHAAIIEPAAMVGQWLFFAKPPSSAVSVGCYLRIELDLSAWCSLCCAIPRLRGHVARSPEGGPEMRFHPWTSTGLSVLGCALLVSTSLAAADSREDVAAATMKWAQTLGQNDPDQVVGLYASDGVLWGTLSPTVRADRVALRDYFVTAFRVLPNLKVTFGQQLIRVYGHTAVNTGYYTFSYFKDGETKTLPARYSFTFVKDGENWIIVDHHSSAMPPAPR